MMTSTKTIMITSTHGWQALSRQLALFSLLLALFSIAPAPASAVTTDDDIQAIAAEQTAQPGNAPAATKDLGVEGPSVAGLMGRLALALGVVLALMAGVLWAARRWMPQATRSLRGGPIELLATRPLGARKSLLMVRARGKTLLIGVTQQSIQTLAVLDGEADLWQEAADGAGLNADGLIPPQAGTTRLEA